MKKKVLFMLSILVLALLAACSGGGAAKDSTNQKGPKIETEILSHTFLREP